MYIVNGGPCTSGCQPVRWVNGDTYININTFLRLPYDFESVIWLYNILPCMKKLVSGRT